MLFKQICGNEGKIITMMDNENGLYGIKTRMDRSEGVLKGKGEILKGGKRAPRSSRSSMSFVTWARFATMKRPRHAS